MIKLGMIINVPAIGKFVFQNLQKGYSWKRAVYYSDVILVSSKLTGYWLVLFFAP